MHRQDNSTYKLQYTMFLKLGSHYPPLCGIVQLTNSAALCFRKWSFTNKKATKTLKYPAANLCASKCLNSTLSLVSCFFRIRGWHDPTTCSGNSQALFEEIWFIRNKTSRDIQFIHIKQDVERLSL